jgi:putative phosphonate metabolism protein
MSSRYAIYFAPEKLSPWWRVGAHWLGRDECDGGALTQPLLEGIQTDELERLTAQPRRYGFHATLKAPFRLANGCDEQTLLSRLHLLAKTLAPMPLGPLRATQLSDFVALVPEIATAELQALAASCVIHLDDLRAPLSKDDLLKRQGYKLDARGVELLALYGYPHVMERFRLHLTLTGPIDAQTAQRVEQAVSTQVAQLNAAAPLALDRLCLFVEKTPGALFMRIADVVLQGITK